MVLDNLNTRRPASLYETFEPKEARRVIQRLEFHYTPKHGSWLNMAEIEFSVFSNQCLNRPLKMKCRSNAKSQPWRPNAIRLGQP